MININEYLYYLVLTHYLIDEKVDVLLSDNYKLTIKVDKDLEWECKNFNVDLLSEISFLVNIGNKIRFISRRKFNNLDSYYRVKMRGKSSHQKSKKLF